MPSDCTSVSRSSARRDGNGGVDLRLPTMNDRGSDRLPLSCFRLRDQRFTVEGCLRQPVHGPSIKLPWHLSYYQIGQSLDCKSTRPACSSWVFVQRLVSLTSCTSRVALKVGTLLFLPKETIYLGAAETLLSFQGARTIVSWLSRLLLSIQLLSTACGRRAFHLPLKRRGLSSPFSVNRSCVT